MTHDVRLSPLAVNDLIGLHHWVATEATAAIADAYLDRIEVRFATLADFPAQRSPRGDLGPDIRTIAFERRIAIAYQIAGRTVTILRVVSAARDLARLFDGPPAS